MSISDPATEHWDNIKQPAAEARYLLKVLGERILVLSVKSKLVHYD